MIGLAILICYTKQITFKKMENLKTIEEVRKKIDELDLEILDLIYRRKGFVDIVVKLKTKDQIIDKARIEFILKKLDVESRKKGLPAEMIRDIWKQMIEGFISYEKKYFEEKK